MSLKVKQKRKVRKVRWSFIFRHAYLDFARRNGALLKTSLLPSVWAGQTSTPSNLILAVVILLLRWFTPTQISIPQHNETQQRTLTDKTSSCLLLGVPDFMGAPTLLLELSGQGEGVGGGDGRAKNLNISIHPPVINIMTRSWKYGPPPQKIFILTLPP